MISEVLKEIAKGCIDEGVRAAVLFGTVTAIAPVTVRVEERLVLDEKVLIVPQALRKRTAELTFGTETKTVTLNPGLRVGDKAVLLQLGKAWLLTGTLGAE